MEYLSSECVGVDMSVDCSDDNVEFNGNMSCIPMEIYENIQKYVTESRKIVTSDSMHEINTDPCCTHHKYMCADCGQGRITWTHVRHFDECIGREKDNCCDECGRKTGIITHNIICDCVDDRWQLNICYSCWQEMLY
jgi:hypothetical protein